MLRYNSSIASGTFNGITSGSAKNGSALHIGSEWRKVADLSAHVVALAQTNTLTLTTKWQVSNNNSDWYDASNDNNAANVILQTGTSGTETAVTRDIAAPAAVYAHRFARLAIVVGVTTGATQDTYAIGYTYRPLTGSEAGG